MYAEILHCKMWEAERKQLKCLYLAAAIMPAVSSHAHPGDHLSQARGLGEGEGPVWVQLAPLVVHYIGQVDEPSILVIAEHLLE